MTFREKLADWISGGMLTGARERADYLSTRNEALVLKAELSNTDCLKANSDLNGYVEAAHDYAKAIMSIMEYVSTQESGTARKVARMCREALGE